MADNARLGQRWASYRPSKGIWFWSCVACIVGTMVIGFNWGGWVTGETATTMAAAAADGARVRLATADCISRFKSGPDATAQLAALKKADSYDRADLIKKAGWATIPGTPDPVERAADACAQRLVRTSPPGAEIKSSSN